MMTTLRTLSLAFVCLSLVACSDNEGVEGNRQLASETRTVEQFVRVENRASYDVQIRPGADFSVTVQIDGNLMPMVTTVVENGTLILGETELIDPEIDDPHVIVSMPTLEHVIVSGTGDAEVLAFDHLAPVKLTVRGDGDIEFAGTAPDLVLEDTGRGEIEIEGRPSRRN